MFCQLRLPFFLLVTALLVGVSCRRDAAPAYDRLESTLLAEALAALSEGELSRAERQLERLCDVAPDESFYAMALDRIEDRRVRQDLNRRLAVGDVAGVRELVKSRGGGTYGVLADARRLPEALAALAEHRRAVPYTSARAAAVALHGLERRSEPLRGSESFQAYLAGARAEVEALRDAELRAAREAHWHAADRAVVAGNPVEARRLLKELLPAAGGGPVSAFIHGAAVGPPAAADLVALARRGAEGMRRVELFTCLYVDALGTATTMAVARGVHATCAATLSGELLRLRHAIGARDTGGALRHVSALTAYAGAGSHLAGPFLEGVVLPRLQFSARCWRTPCPGVTDILSCLQQIRDNPQ